jgi:hypothetical protein
MGVDGLIGLATSIVTVVRRVVGRILGRADDERPAI